MKKTQKTVAFRIDREINRLVSLDAAANETNESAILRRIVYKHYESDMRLKATPDERRELFAQGLREQEAIA